MSQSSQQGFSSLFPTTSGENPLIARAADPRTSESFSLGSLQSIAKGTSRKKEKESPFSSREKAGRGGRKQFLVLCRKEKRRRNPKVNLIFQGK